MSEKEDGVGERPSGGGACCPPSAKGVTYVKVGAGRDAVGMVGLDDVFKQLAALGRQPQETSDEELVGMARRSNWIPSGAVVEAEYANALRGAYEDFLARQKRGAGATR